MKKKISTKKIIIGIVVTIISLSLLQVVSIKLRNLYLIKYNEDYINTYIEDNLSDCKILDIDEYIYIPGFLDGGHTEGCNKDIINKEYTKEYLIYDPVIDYKYYIPFSHVPNEKISMSTYRDRDYYTDLYNKYHDNFKLIANVVEKYHGECKLVSKFTEDEVDKYLIVIYSPDYESCNHMIGEMYGSIYGGYAQDHLQETNDINVDMPRYIFTNDKSTFDNMCKRVDKAQEFIGDKLYECRQSYLEKGSEENYFKLTDVIDKLLDKNVDVNTLTVGGTQLKIDNEDMPNKWVIGFELECGIDYYTYIADLEKLN